MRRRAQRQDLAAAFGVWTISRRESSRNCFSPSLGFASTATAPPAANASSAILLPSVESVEQITVGMGLLDMIWRRKVKPSATRHFDVQQQGIRLAFSDGVHGQHGIGRSSDQFHLGVPGKDVRDRLAHRESSTTKTLTVIHCALFWKYGFSGPSGSHGPGYFSVSGASQGLVNDLDSLFL